MVNGETKGYQIPDTILHVDFTGGKYVGAEVVLRLNVKIGTVLRIQDLADDVSAMLAEFAREVLISWNLLNKDGAPIPPTFEGMLELEDINFATFLMEQWVKAIQGGDKDPLEQTSRNGGTSVELSMPMEIRSQSH